MAREEVLWIFNILPTSKHLTTWHVLTLYALKLSLSDWEFQPGGRNALKLWDRSMTGVSKGQQRGPCCWRLGNKRGAIDDAFRKVIWSQPCAFPSLVVFYSEWLVEYWRVVSRGITWPGFSLLGSLQLKCWE